MIQLVTDPGFWAALFAVTLIQVALGADNLRACETENIVALCDVDWRMAAVTFQRYPEAKRYRDYRRRTRAVIPYLL